MAGAFDGLFGDLFGSSDFAKGPQAPKEQKPEKGIPWVAKTIDGKKYVSLEQVVELLEQNDVLPAVRKGLEKYLSK